MPAPRKPTVKAPAKPAGRKPAAKKKTPARKRPPKKAAAPADVHAPAFSVEMQGKITEGLRGCLPRDVAAELAGLPGKVLAEWLTAGREQTSGQLADLVRAVESAEAEAEAILVVRIAQAARKGDVKAATWLLERTRPERWVRQSVSRILPPSPRPPGSEEDPDAEDAAPPLDPDDEFADLDNVTALRR